MQIIRYFYSLSYETFIVSVTCLRDFPNSRNVNMRLFWGMLNMYFIVYA